MAALFALLLGISSLFLGYLLYDFSKENFLRETEAAINSEIENILSFAEGKNSSFITDHVAKRAARKKHPIYFYSSHSGEKLAGNIASLPQKVELLKEGVIRFEINNGSVAAKIHTFSDGSRLLIARNIDRITASYDRFDRLGMIMILFMLIVIAVSFIISYFVVSRINRIGSIAAQIIETGDITQRVPQDSNWDDLSMLAQMLNDLLDRIEFLMQGMRDVGDSIAHDLRTPLTRLRNELEQAIITPKQAMQPQQLLQEADHILNSFNTLLRISNIEKAKRHQPFKPVNLTNLLQDVIELYEPLAEEKNIAFQSTLAALPPFAGDRDLLFQLFANLLDNAIKFSPNNSEITLTLSHKKKRPIITISDGGIGIPPDERDKVFTRFYRADHSRNQKGNGLGLSLVKAALEIHKGTISLQDNQPGLRVIITFL